MATVRLAPLDPNLVRGELDFRVVQRKVGAEVASVEGVDRSVGEFDVLLRNTPSPPLPHYRPALRSHSDP
jgi:hypothetical protein